MVKNELTRFMQSLKRDDISNDVRKIANLIFNQFDEIAALGTAQGQRSKKLVQLSQSQWEVLQVDITIENLAVNVTQNEIHRLKSLRVGPFRGFAKAEEFILDSQLVLLYGPNGTGKSSFCEALEYAMLGTVAEAESKRFRNIHNYLSNAHTGNFEPPIIEAIKKNGEVVLFTPNQQLFRFCFIEKNRIDNFSRIAANTPAKQTELISTLFGLEAFNDFVRNFSSDLDPKYIDVEGQYAKQFKEEEKSLTIHREEIDKNTETLTALSVEETDLAHRLSPDMIFQDLAQALGTQERPGMIQTLDTKLQTQLPYLTDIKTDTLLKLKDDIESKDTELTAKLRKLSESSESLSFKELYGAIKDLQVSNANQCPACKTPLSKVSQNPFTLAATELDKLSHLSQLEQARDTLKSNLLSEIKNIHKIVKTAVSLISPNPLARYMVENESFLTVDWWRSLHTIQHEASSIWEEIVKQVRQLEERDRELAAAIEDRSKDQLRLTELREIEKSYIQLQTKRKAIEDNIAKSKATILAFEEKNMSLIASVESEKAIIAINLAIAYGYKSFVSMLNKYKDELPSQLVADLGDSVVELYNAFNRNDPEKDKLSSINLPVSPGDNIVIVYKGEPERKYDALHVLSEGHIRCVGLAILLAKNIKENCPVLIFDDPVNAIDDEHRDAIRQTFFNDSFFEGKQIIMAVHGFEFFKNIHQIIGSKTAKITETYNFLPRSDDHHIQFSSLLRPVNYIYAAQNLMQQGNHRDALMSSRRGLELLCNNVWNHYIKYGGGAISVTQRAPKSPIDLYVLISKLNAEIKKHQYDIDNKETIVTSLTYLLGDNGQVPPWQYLNKGTHEEDDREEFDAAIVARIVEHMVNLDQSVTINKK